MHLLKATIAGTELREERVVEKGKYTKAINIHHPHMQASSKRQVNRRVSPFQSIAYYSTAKTTMLCYVYTIVNTRKNLLQHVPLQLTTIPQQEFME